MTEEQQTGDDARQPAVKDDFSGTERAFVRLTFWQTVLSLVGECLRRAPGALYLTGRPRVAFRHAAQAT